jgi:hypothetical protein
MERHASIEWSWNWMDDAWPMYAWWSSKLHWYGHGAWMQYMQGSLLASESKENAQ